MNANNSNANYKITTKLEICYFETVSSFQSTTVTFLMVLHTYNFLYYQHAWPEIIPCYFIAANLEAIQFTIHVASTAMATVMKNAF